MKPTIVVSWTLITLSYYLPSLLLDPSQYYFFDAICRIIIIFAVLKFGRIKLHFSKSQWLSLTILFSLGLVVSHLTFPIIKPIYLIIAIVLAPLMEEIYFRGYVLENITGSQKQRIIITSILFGLYHLKNAQLLTTNALIYQILYAGIFIGPILAYIKLRTNSLFYPIALHSLNNLIAETISKKLFPFIHTKSSSSPT
jgi:membrane protease YdiL (CAAX protease family)